MSNEYYNQLQKLAMKKDFYSKQSQLHNVCWSLDPDDDPSTLFGIQGLKKFLDLTTTQCHPSSHLEILKLIN